MRLEYLLALIVSLAILLAAIIVYFSNKEQKKQTKEIVDKTRMDWAKAFDAADALHLRQANTYFMVIDAKDELIAEKDRRIEQLESQIALNQMVMACAKIDGSIDAKALVKLIETEKGKQEYEKVIKAFGSMRGDADEADC